MIQHDIEILACHGWGLQPSFWDRLSRELPEQVQFTGLNRGYFGKPTSRSFGKGTRKKMLMTHSFGLLWCPEELLEAADHLIIFSGFLHFHPGGAEAEKRSRMVVRQMMGRFIEKPDEVLHKFYETLFYPSERALSPPVSVDHDLLLDDLNRIQHDRISIERFRSIPAFTIFHGGEDAVVPNELGRELYQRLAGRSRYYEVKQAGHALPFTHSEVCMNFLKPIIGTGI
ncbi:MAG: alpha/beta hydrolase [Balneolaceae bacterium]